MTACRPGNHTDAPAAEGEAKIDSTALRLLNLLFTLHVAPEPLTTEQIVGDADMGYGQGNADSEKRKFARDRDRLEDCGVVIREVKAPGSSEREESLWAIDRERTHALDNVVSREDGEAALAAIDEHFILHGDDPVRWPLQRARAKLAQLVNIDLDLPYLLEQSRENTALRHIWSAFERRKAARFTYRDAAGEERSREVEIYAFFTQGTHTYLVGRCCDRERVLTFRTDRIIGARKTPESSATYRVPADFSVERYQFLSFDFSNDTPTEALFSFPISLGQHEIELITHRRGELTRHVEAECWEWRVEVSDLDAAAAFVIEHSSRGMRAVAPNELVVRIKETISKAVKAHGA